MDTSKCLSSWWKFTFDIDLIEVLAQNAMENGDLKTFSILEKVVRKEIAVEVVNNNVENTEGKKKSYMDNLCLRFSTDLPI